MDTMLISQIAEETGFAATTLRYYEDIGLLPAPDRNSAGYRVYGPEHVEALRFIERGKRLGLELDEIGDVLALWRTGDCGRTREQVEELLRSKLAEVHRDLAELQAFQTQLTDAYQRITSRPAPEACGPGCGCPPSLQPTEHARPTLPVHDPGASCTLDRHDADQRLRAWQELAADALQVRERPATGTLILRFDGNPATEARVRELAAAEEGCCAFFELAVTRDGDQIVLTATAPDTHLDYLDLLDPAD